jgi:CRISPR-associated protein Cas2
MILIILEKVSPSVRGEMTKWLLELQSGVFVGDVSGMVREQLWKMACEKLRGGAGIMVQTAANEQGFSFRYLGQSSRKIEEFEGLYLTRFPQSSRTSE